jgi:phosphoadenosine phosphosulfate reductase
MNQIIAEIRSKTQNMDARKLLEHVLNRFEGRIALATSFGAEDQVLTDIICNISPKTRIFTLDTGRLPEQTYEVMEKTRKRYDIDIKVMFPDHDFLEEMVLRSGPNLFYKSITDRKLCCQVRKIEPLKRALTDLDAWICGLRSEQSTTRTDLESVDWDNAFNLVKVCPLADWSTDDVWKYIRDNDLPYNKLHDKGYPSIGCAPCTRPVEEGQDIRAGRWWWETPEHKECGLHLKNADSRPKGDK